MRNCSQMTRVSIHSRRLSREMHEAARARLQHVIVSIHSRRLSREMPPSFCCPPCRPGRFNPLPAVKPGDAAGYNAGWFLVVAVSIHSRRLSREMLRASFLPRGACNVSIHSRRLSREMRTKCCG